MSLEMFLFLNKQLLQFISRLRIQPHHSKSFVNWPLYTPVCKMDFMCD